MLSIGRLGTAGGADYYLDKVANSVDDYYLGRGEAPGQWIGAPSAQLGLVGQVDAQTLRNLLAGTSASGESRGVQLRPERRPGYDLTFSAPKGVSLLWALGPGDVPGTISDAHDRAVVAVLDHLSKEACYARRGRDGKQLIEADGYIGAAFRHRTSRAGDPQLHTHVVVPNLVQGSDGRWSAPDGRHLYQWQKVAGTLYQSALRAELAPLGLAWDVRRNGLSEVRDIPKTVLRMFSKRRLDIEQAMEQRGSMSSAGAAKAALATRPRKPASGVAVDVLREGWVEQLATIGIPDGAGGTRPAGVDDLTAALGGEVPTGPKPTEVEEIFRVLAGEQGVSLDDWEIDEHHLSDTGAPGTRVLPVTLLGSNFSRRDAISAVARAFDVTPEEAAALTARFLDREGVVRVLADPGAGTEHIRTRTGLVVPATSGDRRYTTTELLAAEQRIVRSATGRVGAATAQVGAATVDNVLERHAHLDGEQAQGVRQLLTSGNGYDLVIGQAGTGKSTMLGAARVGWEDAGFRVIGTAVAARTAADLERGTGIPSSSLTQLLADLREGGGLTSRHVIVVDEASMVGTRPLDQLRSYVDGAGAKLVLVGDNRQLSSIDAGGALRTLSAELGDHVVTLTTNRRQAGADQQWERDALAALREGNVTPAVTAYAEQGRVTIAGTIDEARHHIVEDWWAVHRDHTTREHTTAILAIRRSDVEALNDMVRARRQAAGELGEELRIGAKAFSVGDRVIFQKNQRVPAAELGGAPALLRLRNGTFGTVVAVTAPTKNAPTDNTLTREGDVRRTQGDVAGDIEDDARAQLTGSLVVQLDDGSRAVLPRSYAETSTSLGYALTVFRSQGMTVDHTFGLGGDSLYQEAGYTQLSRGRLSNSLYVASPENPRWEIGHHADDLTQRDGLQSLVDALSQNREQTMARDRLPTWPTVASEDLDAAFREHASLGQWIADHAPADVTRQLADAYLRPLDTSSAAQSLPGADDDVKTLLAAQGQREAWVGRHRTEIDTWSRLDSDLRRHEYRLGQAAAYSQPDHTTALLGPLPERITSVERWQSASGAIEAYRGRWGVDAADALGPEPLDPERRVHWQRAVGTIESAGFTALGSSDGELDQPWLSSLWDRVHALDTARSDAAHDMVPLPEPPPFSWSRDSNSGPDLGDGFGL
ncbi:MAG: relaxase domain-containing protein [Acidimicrobiales bacterium]|nr:relaxase domain-containing protein [Acidimicrobiales bacterium]